MPIRIPDSLPAKGILDKENIFVITQFRALHQDIRPLKLLILNLMPTKIVTETQLLRKLSNTPLQVEIDLLRTISHESKNVDSDHLASFYISHNDIRDKYYDGMIITGAPVENLDFKDVDYWPELCEIMEWSKSHVHSTFHICWGAQAGLYYHYGIQKYSLPKKMSGIYSHKILRPNSPFFRGFDDYFNAPHSRYTEVRQDDIEKVPELEILAISDEAGVFAVKNHRSRQFFVFGHPEYDRETLALEYRRDTAKGTNIHIPAHYFPNDDPTKEPVMTWRAHAQLMYTNWLNYYVYQTTPYVISSINPDNEGEDAELTQYDNIQKKNAVISAAFSFYIYFKISISPIIGSFFISPLHTFIIPIIKHTKANTQQAIPIIQPKIGIIAATLAAITNSISTSP